MPRNPFGKSKRKQGHGSASSSLDASSGDAPRGRKRESSKPRGGKSKMKQPVLTVEALRKLKSKQLDKGVAPAEDLYNIAKTNFIDVVKSTLKAASPVFTPEIQHFFSVQTSLRHSLAKQKNGRSLLSSQSKNLMRERNDALKAAHKSLSRVDPKVAPKVVAAIKIVVTTIKDGFRTRVGVANTSPALRLRYYPMLVVKDGDGSPEQVFDGFLAMQMCISAFEGKSRQHWVESGNEDLYALFNQLALILTERFQKGPGAVQDLVADTMEAFKAIEKGGAAWHSGSFQKAIAEAYSSLQKSLRQFCSAKLDVDIVRIKSTQLGYERARSFPKCREYDEFEKHSQALYSEQKKYFKTISEGWNLINSGLPELGNDLYPIMHHHTETILQSIDIDLDYSEILRSFVSDRCLHDYDNCIYPQQDLIQCTFKGEKTILKRFNVANRFEAKAFFKELVIHAKIAAHAVERVQSVFGEGSTMYIHIARGDTTFEHLVRDEKFVSTATSVVLCIRQMVRVVFEVHATGVVHGNIRPAAWFVTESGLPKLHAFDASRIRTQVSKSVRESIVIAAEDKKYRCPRVGNVATFEGDMFGLGMCITDMARASDESLNNARVLDFIKSIIIKCICEDVAKRITAREAFKMTNDLFGKLRQAIYPVRKQKEELKHLEEELAKSRKELERAANAAESDLTRVAKVAEGMRKQEAALAAKQKRLQEDRKALIQRQTVDDSLKPPLYWITKSLDQMINIHPVDNKGALFQVFRHVVQTDDKKSLNQGRDVVERGNYSFLEVVGVWRVENSLLWQKYATERSNIRNLQRERNLKFPKVRLRENLEAALAHLPGAEHMYRDINETYLLHGTKADVVLTIATYGINERFTTVALFGKGSYFAEDVAKNDQYTIGDGTLGAFPELHRRLFPAGGCYNFPVYPLKAYYLVLCRVVMGHPVRVKCTNSARKEMHNICHPDKPIFATADQRELSAIPGVGDPPIFYHSLLAEKGGSIVRFREFVQFHSTRIYPEYIICYTRK